MEERIIKDINNLLTQLFQKMKEEGYEWDAEKKVIRNLLGGVKRMKKIEQKSAAWSEEDEKIIHNIDAAIRHEVMFPTDKLKSMKIWLESLKCRIRPKHEWKRDEKMFQLIEDVIDVYRKTQGSVIGGIHTEELKCFLNCMSSRQDWKPSDEQMNALWDKISNDNLPNSEKEISQQVALAELYEQLKKLKGE